MERKNPTRHMEDESIVGNRADYVKSEFMNNFHSPQSEKGREIYISPPSHQPRHIHTARIFLSIDSQLATLKCIC
jgi:hypothetical protein